MRLLMTPGRPITVIISIVIAAALAIGSSPRASAQDLGDVDWFAPDFAPLWRVRGEYLGWWTNGNHLPPLVTTSPPGTARLEAGVLGTNGVQTLFGDRFIDTGVRSGGRVTMTRWLEDAEDTAVE